MNRDIKATRENCLVIIDAIHRLNKKGHEDLTIEEIAIEAWPTAYINQTREGLDDLVWRCLKRIIRARPEEYDAIVFGLTDDETDGRRVMYYNILEANEKSNDKYEKSVFRKDKETRGKQNFKQRQISYAKEKGLLPPKKANYLLGRSA